jgi:hypothetical protein
VGGVAEHHAVAPVALGPHEVLVGVADEMLTIVL